MLPNFTGSDVKGSGGKNNAPASGSSVYTAPRNTSGKQKHYKVICVGESNVGKTCLIQRYINNVFIEHGN
jgi:GTPase SAR1 family protein